MKKHCELFDANYDSDTGEWLEDKCGNENCDYCSKRPKEHKPHKWNFIDGTEGWCGKGKEDEHGK